MTGLWPRQLTTLQRAWVSTSDMPRDIVVYDMSLAPQRRLRATSLTLHSILNTKLARLNLVEQPLDRPAHPDMPMLDVLGHRLPVEGAKTVEVDASVGVCREGSGTWGVCGGAWVIVGWHVSFIAGSRVHQ